jgi:serine protease inhibitor
LNIFQKVFFIQMNEAGTEAAAATAVLMMEGGMAFIEENPRFEADHPFAFVLANGKLQMLFNGIFDG